MLKEEFVKNLFHFARSLTMCHKKAYILLWPKPCFLLSSQVLLPIMFVGIAASQAQLRSSTPFHLLDASKISWFYQQAGEVFTPTTFFDLVDVGRRYQQISSNRAVSFASIFPVNSAFKIASRAPAAAGAISMNEFGDIFPGRLLGGSPDLMYLKPDRRSVFVDSKFSYRLNGSGSKNTLHDAVDYRGPSQNSYRSGAQGRKRGKEQTPSIVAFFTSLPPIISPIWYFYLTITFLCIAIPVHFFRRRVQLIESRIGIVLEERNRIARECHDALMAGFAATSWQLEATAKLFRDSGLASTPAAESCEIARSMLAHCQAETRRIIWDLRDPDEATNLLSQALTRTVNRNHVQRGIEITLDVEGDERPLAPGLIHHLVCIGQESITNAIRHARPSRIDVRLKYARDALCLCIRDNGCGIPSSDGSASRQGHFGIPVMEERARKLGGTFRLQTGVGVGTEVTVEIFFNAVQQLVNQEHHVIRWIGI